MSRRSSNLYYQLPDSRVGYAAGSESSARHHPSANSSTQPLQGQYGPSRDRSNVYYESQTASASLPVNSDAHERYVEPHCRHTQYRHQSGSLNPSHSTRNHVSQSSMRGSMSYHSDRVSSRAVYPPTIDNQPHMSDQSGRAHEVSYDSAAPSLSPPTPDSTFPYLLGIGENQIRPLNDYNNAGARRPPQPGYPPEGRRAADSSTRRVDHSDGPDSDIESKHSIHRSRKLSSRRTRH